jgi:hypothetical protein
VEIPQVLSAALAAGVFICIAQRTGAHFLNPESSGWQDCVLSFAALLTIGAWNAKNFIDDFKAFARRDDAAFSLGPTVAFSAATFTTLGVAATLLFDGLKANWALVAFFLLCSAWSATSWWRRSKKNASDLEVPKRLKRFFWYLACSAVLGAAAYQGFWVWSLLALMFVLIVFVIDAREYRTFFSSMQEVPA